MTDTMSTTSLIAKAPELWRSLLTLTRMYLSQWLTLRYLLSPHLSMFVSYVAIATLIINKQMFIF